MEQLLKILDIRKIEYLHLAYKDNLGMLREVKLIVRDFERKEEKENGNKYAVEDKEKE